MSQGVGMAPTSEQVELWRATLHAVKRAERPVESLVQELHALAAMAEKVRALSVEDQAEVATAIRLLRVKLDP